MKCSFTLKKCDGSVPPQRSSPKLSHVLYQIVHHGRPSFMAPNSLPYHISTDKLHSLSKTERGE